MHQVVEFLSYVMCFVIDLTMSCGLLFGDITDCASSGKITKLCHKVLLTLITCASDNENQAVHGCSGHSGDTIMLTLFNGAHKEYGNIILL